MVNREHRSLSDLFQVAQRVAPPPIDVTGRVLETLRTCRPAAVSDAPLWVAAALSVAAAAAVLVMVLAQGATMSDPFVQWFSSYVVVAL